MKEAKNYPLIFDIHRCALDDGPGIRTTVFLKGCPLRCVWCHNPESLEAGAEIAFYPDRCVRCCSCEKVCSIGAINQNPGEWINRKLCVKCGLCTDECPSLALKRVGTYYDEAELVEVLKLDRVFYDTSGGGVTFSGGEPMLYMDYVSKVMEVLKREGIHIAVQTCGYFDYGEFKEKILPYIDMVFYDVKFIDSDTHKKYTGRSNELILENFKSILRETGIHVIPRLPLVPGITANTENLTAVADFISKAGCKEYVLLSYNSGGITKLTSIGKDVHLNLQDSMPQMQEEQMCRELFANRFRGI
ncbi:MAG: glycyl-radical enzyme activating protein [Clostridia bacterium]|nr:glycyl-radical enzyme activating protein [Clostridia bacterium]